jgi:hypothetical protein
MAAPSTSPDPFALCADGTAADPVAFQAALKADPDKLAQVQQDPDMASVLLGTDMAAMQALLRAAYEVGASLRCSLQRCCLVSGHAPPRPPLLPCVVTTVRPLPCTLVKG